MYYIYHIPGVKIGCTKIGKRRITVQGYDNYEILESYDDITIAAEREKELQIQYGYKVDKIKYDEAKYSEMGKVAGDKAVQTGHIKKIQKIGTKIAASKPRTKSQLESFKKTREIGARIAWSKPRTDLQLESMKIAQQLHFNSPNF